MPSGIRASKILLSRFIILLLILFFVFLYIQVCCESFKYKIHSYFKKVKNKLFVFSSQCLVRRAMKGWWLFENDPIVIYFRRQLIAFLVLVDTTFFSACKHFLKLLKLYNRNNRTETILILVRKETYSIY